MNDTIPTVLFLVFSFFRLFVFLFFIFIFLFLFVF